MAEPVELKFDFPKHWYELGARAILAESEQSTFSPEGDFYRNFVYEVERMGLIEGRDFTIRIEPSSKRTTSGPPTIEFWDGETETRTSRLFWAPDTEFGSPTEMIREVVDSVREILSPNPVAEMVVERNYSPTPEELSLIHI